VPFSTARIRGGRAAEAPGVSEAIHVGTRERRCPRSDAAADRTPSRGREGDRKLTANRPMWQIRARTPPDGAENADSASRRGDRWSTFRLPRSPPTGARG